MTRRERLERRAERRREWAEKAEGRAAERFDAAHRAVEHIPFGQPILVGHHSEKTHRSALDRCDKAMHRGVEESDKATHHTSKADGIERQLERSIFSDDPDAIEQLEAKVAALEARRAQWKALNAYWRKHGTMKGCPGVSDATAAQLDAEIPKRYSWEQQPIPTYRLSNLSSEIRRAKERVKDIQERAARTASADAAPGGVLIEGDVYVRVTFAEKPEREVLDDLKAAGFRWSRGHWVGDRSKLPASVAVHEGVA